PLGPLVNTATVSPAPGASDPVPADATASDTTLVLERAIFSDGFESGDVSRWTTTVP
ncbi:MAG: hypothetical protein HC897_18760, partial [Thermoanaerobaculia bacterium]|nr:hypothetical protein [Thermoanaerobaculia bacterium]